MKDHLDSIGYEGPLGLSCDDTKLLASFRLYWDSSEDSHFLAGAVGGPIRVADPERVQSVLDDATIQKASKVCCRFVLVQLCHFNQALDPCMVHPGPYT